MTLYSENLVLPSPLQEWKNDLFDKKEVKVYIKRDDLIHPILSGNKYRKLKYNLMRANELGHNKLMSFGGAFSNHLYAMAGVAKFTNFKVEMIIRGDELTADSSPTLQFAADVGVQLTFVSRSLYRNKEKLSTERGSSSYVIPEGGSNQQCLQGIHEMVTELESQVSPTHICAAIGSGGTIAGICSAPSQVKFNVIGVPVLKNGDFLREEVNQLLAQEKTNRKLELFTDYHFGGYAKHQPTLLKFIEEFESQTQVPLEHVYTGKLFFGIKKEIENEYFLPNSIIVIYHSGGLQGKIKRLNRS